MMQINNRFYFSIYFICIWAVFFVESPQAQDLSFDDLLNRQVTVTDDEMTPNNLSDTNDNLDFLNEDIRTFEDHTKVNVRILDKVTAQSQSFELEIGKTVAYGGLRIRPQICKKSSPIDEPESASFLQIWERQKNGEGTWIFSGWMFASSPSLSAMEHPVYDVWVLDCAGDVLETDSNDSAKN